MNLKMGVAFFNAAPIFLSYRNTTLTPAKGMHKGISPIIIPIAYVEIFYLLLFDLQSLRFFQPDRCTGITRHSQIPSWRQRNRTHLRSVRKTGSLKLLREKPSAECLKPLLNRCSIILAIECLKRQPVNFLRSISKTQHVIQIQIMEFGWAH